MLMASEQVESISLRIDGFTIKFSRARFHYSQGEAPESMPCTSPRDHLEQEARTNVSQPTNDQRDHFSWEGGSA